MIKIPADRAKAADASFPTLVDAGSVFLSMRLTQARGGSNSTAVGRVCGLAGVDEAPAAAGASLVDTIVPIAEDGC